MTEDAVTPEGRVEGLPLWYFVMAGLLVASQDISTEFTDRYEWVSYIPLGLVLVHLVLWFTVFRRRARYWKAVLRSPAARLLALGLALLRVALGFALQRLYSGNHEHLILAVTMFVVVPASAYCDQLLILRTLRRGGVRAGDSGTLAKAE
jgi:uncharacterized membrane protein